MTPENSTAALGLLCVAHGTVETTADLPEFLKVIRRGRPATEALIAELTRRYERIGGSPLNAVTASQANAVGAALGLPALWGMRLWKPWVAEVLKANASHCARLCVLPLAPFSVHVYAEAAQAALVSVFGEHPPVQLFSVDPWGSHPRFISWFADRISQALVQSSAPTEVILTAHSLPTRAIQDGDPYQSQVTTCADAVARKLGISVTLAYQSQGADGGDWLGPDLKATLQAVRARGTERVIVAPVGFVSEHVETLYDLDVEAAGWANDLGLDWIRIGAPNADPEFVEVLVDVVRTATAKHAAT